MRTLSTVFIYICITVALCLSVEQSRGQGERTDTVYDERSMTPPAIDNIEDDGDEKYTTVGSGTIEASAKQVSGDTILNLKRQREFYYMAYLDSLLRSAKDKEAPKPKTTTSTQTKVEERKSVSVFDTGFVKVLCWMVAIGVLGYVIFKLFIGGNPVFAGASKKLIPPVEIAEEELDEENLEGYLNKAIRNKNYRLAVRYQFLKTLQRLGEKGILKLSIDKTNHQYASELLGKPYAHAFARLSLQYEYAWFGGFDLTEEQFAFVQQQHTKFLKDI